MCATNHQGNRKSYSEDSQNHIRRQRETIEKLKADNQALKNEMALELKDAALAPQPTVQAEITKLQVGRTQRRAPRHPPRRVSVCVYSKPD